MKSNELLRLFITYETRGGDRVRREWKEMERSGEKLEQNLDGLGDGYVDLGKNAEASGKKQRSSFAKTAESIGSVRKETQGLAADSRETSKAADGMADAFGNAADRSVSELKKLKGALDAIGDDKGSMEIGIAIDEASKREAQAEIARFKAGLDDETVNVRIDYDKSQLNQIGSGFREAASGVRAFEVLAGTVAIPGIIAGLGGAVPMVVALTGATARLASGLGAGLGGAAAIGGTAVGGLTVGLKAYGAVISSTVSASREAYLATNEQAAALLEERRQRILSTNASTRFNQQLDRVIITLSRIQAAVGNAVFPMFTRELGAWDLILRRMTPHIAATSGKLAEIATRFSTFIRTARGGNMLASIFRFISQSAIRAGLIISNMGKGALTVLDYLIAPATRLQSRIVAISAAFSSWAGSQKGAQQISAAVGFLERRMNQLFSITGNLGRALFNVFAAVNRSTNMENILNPLVFGMRNFADAIEKGSAGASKITSFMQRAQPALNAFKALVAEAGRQILILANNVIRAGQSGGKIGTLATVINSVKDSLAPIRVLLQQTFIQMGPALARLIPAVVKFASAFLGSSNVLVSFINRITQLLNGFNRLPAPVKSIIIEAVALNGIMKLLGGPTMLGLVGALMRSAAAFGTLRAAQSASRAANVAAGTSTAALTLRQRAGALATRAWALASRGAALAARGLGIALRFMLGPWGLLIAAIALGVVVIIKNWDKIRPALQPAINAFNVAKRVVQTLGKIFGAAFSGNIPKARALIASLPGPLRQAGMFMARLGVAAKKLVTGGIDLLRRGVQQVISFFRSNWPTIQRTGSSVLTAFGRAIRTVAGPVLAFLRRGVQQIVGWFRQNWPLIQRTAETVFRALATVVKTQINAVRTVIMAVVGAVVAFWKANSTQILAIAKSSWTIIKTVISAAVRIVGNVIKAVMLAITGNWKGSWAAIQQAGKIAWQAIQTVVKAGIDIVKNLMQIGINTVKSLWSAAWTYVGNKTEDARTRIGTIVKDLTSGLKSTWQAIKSAAEAAWTEISGLIWRPIETAYNKVTEFIGKILDAVNSVLEKVGLPPIGGGSGGTPAEKSQAKKGLGPGSPAAAAKGGIYHRSGRTTGLRRMAKGGIIGQDPVGGIADGHTPRAVFGEAGDAESYTVWGRTDNIPYGEKFANSVGMTMVPKPKRQPEHRHEGGGHGMARGGILRGWRGMGVAMHALGATKHEELWTKRTAQIARETQDAVGGVAPNTYVNHPIGYEERAPYSIDWWGSGGRGDAIGTSKGDSVLDHILGKYVKEMSYWLWNAKASSSVLNKAISQDPHRDHVHATFKPGLNMMSGQGGTSGGGGMIPNPLQIAFEQAWKRLVEPVVNTFLNPLKNADYLLSQAAGAAAQKIPDGIYQWIDEKIPDTIGGGGSGGGTTAFSGDWATAKGGGPSENRGIGKAAAEELGWSNQWGAWEELGNRESGWDRFAKNPSSGAYGIPQSLPESKLPKAGQSSGGSNAGPQVGWMGDYIKGRYGDPQGALNFHDKNNWYEKGGLAIGPQLAGIGEGRNELMLPLGERRVQSQVQSLFMVDRMAGEMARMRGALEGGIRVESYGDRAAQTIREGYHNAPRRYVGSREGRTDVGRQMDRRDELERISRGGL